MGRLRIVFEDDGVLTKSQIKSGLKFSWVLLKPKLLTIHDLVSYLIHTFSLHHSCPNSILLSMDGFVLPPFESISILKDKDIIRVKRKGIKFHDVTKAIEGANTFVEDEIIEKQPLPTGMQYLTNGEYGNEIGGDHSETNKEEHELEENVLPVENVSKVKAITKKRKACGAIEKSKTKKQCQVTPESVQKKHGRSCEHTVQEKKKHKNRCKADPISKPAVGVKCSKNPEPPSDSKNEPNENGEMITPVSGVCDDAKKVSRRSRRKRLKRMRIKMQKGKYGSNNKSKSEAPVEDLNAGSRSEKDANVNIIQQQEAVEESDAEGELVPVEIRPGHIRFAPTGEDDWDVQSNGKADWEGHSAKRNGWDAENNKVQKNLGEEKQSTSSWKESKDSPNLPQQTYPSSHGGRLCETFKWNGTTNKKKGQRWGREVQPTSSWKESRDYNAYSSHMQPTQKQLPNDVEVDFEKLVPLHGVPKAGDVVAYRLLELSSSWCPELSPFRIGRIKWFEPESNRIMLVPDPEYPLNLEKKTDDYDYGYDDGYDDGVSGELPESVYNEDGSCEVDFSSLADVRIVKRSEMSPPEAVVRPVAHETPTSSSEISESSDETQDRCMDDVVSDACNGELPSAMKERDINEVPSGKNAQVMQVDNCNKKEKTGKQSGSQRTLHTSALGPIMAILRAQNNL